MREFLYYKKGTKVLYQTRQSNRVKSKGCTFFYSHNCNVKGMIYRMSNNFPITDFSIREITFKTLDSL